MSVVFRPGIKVSPGTLGLNEFVEVFITTIIDGYKKRQQSAETMRQYVESLFSSNYAVF